MPLTQFFSRPTRPHWTYDSAEGSLIWKLIPAATLIVIDERNPKEFTSRLVALDVRSGDVLWRADSPFGPWWSNLTAVSGERAILEGYAAPDLPISKGISALDLHSGEQSWIDTQAQLLEIRSPRIKVRTAQYGIERVAWRDIATGDEASEAPMSEETLPLYPQDASEAELTTALSKRELETLTGPIELLETGPFRIISFYLQNPRSTSDLMTQTFRCELIVVKDASIIFRETLASHSPFPVAGNFVVESDILIYVQEKTRLVGVHLT